MALGERVNMTDLTYYAAKIEECRRLVDSSNDPLYRDVYQAMADEFEEKYAALRQRSGDRGAQSVPPSPLLYQIAASAPEAAAVSAEPVVVSRGGLGRGSVPDTRRRKRMAALSLRPV